MSNPAATSPWQAPVPEEIRRRIERMLATLRRLEWSGAGSPSTGGGIECPDCQASEGTAHYADCELAEHIGAPRMKR